MIVPLDTFQTFVGSTEPTQHTLLTGILARAESFAIRMIGRDIIPADRKETLDGHGERVLALKHFPIISVASIETLSNGTWAAIDPIEYSVSSETGEIRFPTTSVPRGFGNVRVSYRAWFDPIPSDIVDAVLQIALSLYTQHQSRGIKRERVNGDEIEYRETESVPSDAESILQSYRPIHV